MLDYQEIANGIGATLRAAENAADNEGATETKAHLVTLHEQLGQAYLAANELGADLDWSEIAGGSAGRADGPHTESGGTGKDEPVENGG